MKTQKFSVKITTLQDKDSKLLPNNKRTLPERLPIVRFYFYADTDKEKHNEKNGKGTLFFTIIYNQERSNHKTTNLRGYKKDWNVVV